MNTIKSNSFDNVVQLIGKSADLFGYFGLFKPSDSVIFSLIGTYITEEQVQWAVACHCALMGDGFVLKRTKKDKLGSLCYMEFTSKKVGSPRKLVFKRSGSSGFTITQNIEDPDNTPWVPYKNQLVATEIFPYFVDNPLVTTNDIRKYIEALTIHYGTDVIPLKKLLDNDKRLPEEVLRYLRSHHPLFGEKSYSLIEDFVDGISVAGGYGTCVLETGTEHFLREQENLRKEKKKLGVIVDERQQLPPKKLEKLNRKDYILRGHLWFLGLVNVQQGTSFQ